MNVISVREHVLILIDFDTYSIDLIKKGVKLAKQMNSKYSVLLIANKGNKLELDLDFYYVLSECKKACNTYEVEDLFVRFFQTDNDFVHELTKICMILDISQIVLAKDVMSRWEEIIHGSKSNFLLRTVPSVDLHFVTVEKTELENTEYDTAVHGYLFKTSHKEYALTFSEGNKQSSIEGIFFKQLATDFNTGIFVSLDDQDLTHYEVVDNKAYKSCYQLKDYLSS